MSLSKPHQRTVPIPPDVDLDTARWLVRESFETTAALAGLLVTDYRDDETVDPADIDPAVAEHLDLPIADYTWRRFTATFVRPEPGPQPDICGYCAPHRSHKTPCHETDCPCPGWPL